MMISKQGISNSLIFTFLFLLASNLCFAYHSPTNIDSHFYMKQSSYFRKGDYIHYLWTVRRDGRAPLVYTLINKGKIVAERMITDENVFARNPRIYVDEDGNVHAIWQERIKAAGVHLKYKRFSVYGGEIVNVRNWEIRPEKGRKARHPDIFVDDKGRAYIVWEEKEGVVLAWVSREGNLKKMLFKGRLHRQAMPSVFASRKGVVVAWNGAGGKIELRSCCNERMKTIERQTIPAPPLKDTFSRRILIGYRDGIKITLVDSRIKGHLEGGNERRFYLSGEGSWIPVHDIRTDGESLDHGIEDANINHEKGFLITDGYEIIGDETPSLRDIYGVEDVPEREYLISYLPHGPPAVKTAKPPSLICTIFKSARTRARIVYKEYPINITNKDSGQGFSIKNYGFSPALHKNPLKGGDTGEEAVSLKMVLNYLKQLKQLKERRSS